MSQIRFKFAPGKALAALHWMVQEWAGVDLHTILKTCYFADKQHLNEFGRPIFGATYRAMRFGPVPLEIYEMAKGESLWLSELGIDAFPWRLDGYRLNPVPSNGPDLTMLSESDRSSLAANFAMCREMTFDERTRATHGPDWQAAALGQMQYEDMIEIPDRAQLVEHLRANARFMRL